MTIAFTVIDVTSMFLVTMIEFISLDWTAHSGDPEPDSWTWISRLMANRGGKTLHYTHVGYRYAEIDMVSPQRTQIVGRGGVVHGGAAAIEIQGSIGIRPQRCRRYAARVALWLQKEHNKENNN